MNSWTSIASHWLEHSPLPATLLDLSLKSFLILALASGVCFGWRRTAASTRHLVWFVAVGGLLCLPALSLLLPSWQRPLWSVGARANSQNELTVTLELVPASTIGPSLRQTPAPAPSPTSQLSELSSRVKRQRLATHFPTGWAAWVLAVWASGTIMILLSVLVAHWRLRTLLRPARSPVKGEWLALLRLLCQEFRISRRVDLWQSAENLMPVTWGWWRPVILIPTEADGWSPERRRVVLLHELAHVKRWDCLTQMIARLACAVYWFNPLAWLAARRMCIERERACDDLVLNGGCKASDYATHLVEIAVACCRVPQVAAIAMARSSNLEGRISAIVDASRIRRAPRALLVSFCCVVVLAFVAAVAAQKPEVNSTPQASEKPWFDARLRAFFTAKAAQARQLAQGKQVPPEVWPYFEAGMTGDWQTATNLWITMRGHAHQYERTTPQETLDKVWSPILETDLAWEQFANWKEKYVLAYGDDIIKSIPPGSIYFGGTDPGRGVITAMSASHAEGKPFFTVTQNAFADRTYLDYLRAMYGGKIYTPSDEDSKNSFAEYIADVQGRLQHDNAFPSEPKQIKPDEGVRLVNGRVEVHGQIAVMSINALLAKIVFERNPSRECYIEESFPLDWMYPHLTPNGLIMKINRQPLPALSNEVVQQDHEYWSTYVQPMLGDWLSYDTTVTEVASFVRKVYVRHDLSGFTGDPQFIADTWAQKAFSKLRSSIGGVYAWRAQKTPGDSERMVKEADFAFRQTYALCPGNPDPLFRYVTQLVSLNRVDDAILLVETTLQLTPDNAQVKDLLTALNNCKSQK